MARYNYPDSYVDTLFDTVSPLIRGFVKGRREKRRAQDRSAVLEKAYPEMSTGERETISRLGHNEYLQMLQTLEKGKAEKSRRSLASKLGLDEEQVGAMADLSSDDQLFYLRNLQQEKSLSEQEKKEIRREERRIEAEKEREKRQEKRFWENKHKEALIDEYQRNGFTKKQAIKLVRGVSKGKTPKGLPQDLKRLFSLKSNYVNGKIGETDLPRDPADLALIKGLDNPAALDKAKKKLQLAATRKIRQMPRFKKMSPVEKQFNILKLSSAYGKPFGLNLDKPIKPTKEDIKISKKMERIEKEREKQKILEEAAKKERNKQIAWNVAWEEFGGE